MPRLGIYLLTSIDPPTMRGDGHEKPATTQGMCGAGNERVGDANAQICRPSTSPLVPSILRQVVAPHTSSSLYVMLLHTSFRWDILRKVVPCSSAHEATSR